MNTNRPLASLLHDEAESGWRPEATWRRWKHAVCLACGLWIVALGGIGAIAPSVVWAQQPLVMPQQTYPSETYYQALAVYRTGELSTAIKGFEQALSRTRRDSRGRWIDAIPVHAMLAECHYEAGNLRLAHEHLDQALIIQERFSGWIGSLQWPPPQAATVQTTINRAPWWRGPGMRPAYSPRKVPINMTSTTVGPGPDGQVGVGAVNTAKSIDALEILRGLGLVYYRRQIILGPLAANEPLLSRSMRTLGNVSPQAGPLGRSVVSSVRALAELANGGGPQVAASASGSATINGNEIHPLTPVLLCGAARGLAASDRPEAAYPLAMRAAAAAALLEQPEWAAEGFEIAVGVKPAAQAAELYTATTAATQTFGRDGRIAAARVGIVAIEAAMDAGRPSEAVQAFQAASAMLDRRNVELPRRSAYFQYLHARINAAAGDLQGSDAAIGQLVAFTSRRGGLESTPRLYQLRLIESAARAAKLGGKTSETLLGEYLRGPTTATWLNDPVDALGFLAADHSNTMAAWVRAAATRRSGEDVLVRGDLLAARMFTSHLPLAGRVLQARWLAAAPDDALTADALTFRKTAPPALARLRQLTSGPIPEDSAAARQQGDAAEAAAYTVALQRLDLPMAFPRPFTSKSDLEPLNDKQAVLAYILAGNNLLGVLAAGDKVTVWPVNGYRALPMQIARLMQEIGVVRRRGGAAQLPENDETWRNMAVEIRKRLVPDVEALAEVEQLVVVPTAALWYVPFELLPTADPSSNLLGQETQIRYAPTPGLAVHGVPAADGEPTVGVLNDLFFALRDGERNEVLAGEIRDAIENPVPLPGAEPLPGRWIGTRAAHVIVGMPITPSPPTAPFAWSPLGYDSGMPGGQLNDWMRLPWASPQSIALPGLRTGARQVQSSDGNELFFAALALHGSGVSDVILARWPVGGESTALLLKEYAQELAFIGVEDAWRRAIAVLRETELDPTTEPVLNDADAERTSLTGEPPLFWSGYMLLGGFSQP